MNIAIVSESIGRDTLLADFTYELTTAAHEFHHNVTVLTSQPDAQHPDAEVLCPFKNWGVLEMKNGIAILETYQPHLLQIVQPHGPLTKKWVSNLPALLTFAKLRFQAKIAIHFLDLNLLLKNKYINSQLLQLADLVTTPGFAIPDHMQVKTEPIKLGVFKRADLASPCEREKKFLVPDAPTNWSNPEKSIDELFALMKNHPDHQLLIASTWNSTRNTLIKTYKARLQELEVQYVSDPRPLFPQIEAVLLNPLKLDSNSFYLNSQNCMETATPGILSTEQYQNFNMLWNEGKNCQVIDDLSYFNSKYLDLHPDGFDDQISNLSRIYTDL